MSKSPSRLRRFFAILLLLGVAMLAFVWLPIPPLEPSAVDSQQIAKFEQRTAEHFASIEQGSDLDRPFPEVVERPDNVSTPAKVELGRLLYFDPLLSGENDVSCAHCHHPDLGLSDNRGRSMGRGGKGLGPQRSDGSLLRRGSPTVWNSLYNHLQFWDGRAKDLEDQAGKPTQDANEMAQSPTELVAELADVPEYVELFEQAFGEAAAGDAAPGDAAPALSFTHVTYALAAFERTLVSNNSRFDQYARGDRRALSDSERRGLNVFRSLETRCFECHNLPTFANRDFKVIGVPDVEGLEAPDLGRSEIDGGDAYQRAFKVPTLRNVALTAPYMHNGRFETLSEVIDFYAGGGGVGHGMEVPNLDDKIRPFSLLPSESQDLIAFLHSLTDESAKPAIPEAVPSGLPVVPALDNQSPEMVAFVPPPADRPRPAVRREGNRLLIGPGEKIQDGIDAARPGDTVAILPGIYHETLTLDISDITLEGIEQDGRRPLLDGRGLLADGIIGSGSNLVLRGFDVRHYTANGIMINLGNNVRFENLQLADTGLYGLYPVEVVGVEVIGCVVTGARDAGIYVGQSRDIQVSNCLTHGNVTGIEIENSINAVVENNEVYDNAGGILVFGLPNNPSKVSRGCVVRNNHVYDNNHVNFGDPSAVVSRVPSGTGIMILAGDDVEVTANEITGNRSFGIAVAGMDTLFGSGSTYDMDPFSDGVSVFGNTMSDNGLEPDAFVTDAGFDGADLLWDLSGSGNSWQQPGATRLPYTLPAAGWSDFRRRAHYKFWRLLMSL